MTMNMTHYMELLATNQPWNLIFFMAIPVILAETLAITELWKLLTGRNHGFTAFLNKISGILVGICFVGIIPYLFITVVIPLTINGGWRGPADIFAVIGYLLSGLPMIYIMLMELGLVNRKTNDHLKLKYHVICVAMFLVLAHFAMIFGMLDPSVMGYTVMDAMNSHFGH